MKLNKYAANFSGMLNKSILFLLLIFCVFSAMISKSQVVANFTSDDTTGCGLLELEMINLSTGASSYYWQVFDESGIEVASSTLSNPSFFLTVTGSYTVELTATGVSGSDFLSIPGFATVYTNPNAEFISSGTEGCLPLTLTFTNTSTPGTYGSLSDFYWIITGAGALPDTDELTYTFNSPGLYTVYIFVEDGAGCSDYYTTDIQVFDAPSVDFIADSTVSCSLPLTTHFTNLSSGSGDLIYAWNFGDGATSSATNPTHTFSEIGNFDVSLTVTDAIGCSSTFTAEDFIIINTTLNVDFSSSLTTVCAGNSIEFTNLSDAVVGTWLWDFGDGSTSSAFEPTHTYTSAGIYTVSLSGDFGGGCTGFISYPSLMNVIASPTVSFTSTDPNSYCSVPLTVSFTPSVAGGPVTFLWEFETPDGISTSTAIMPNFLWSVPGSYDVALTVTNILGCSAEISIPDYVTIGTLEVVPIATPESGCIPLSVSFEAIAGDELTEFYWDFGDGTTSTSVHPTHVYNTVDCFDMMLIASTADGCIDTTFVNDFICAGESGTALLGVPDTSCPSVKLEVFYLPLDSIELIIDGGLDYFITTTVDSNTTVSMEPGFHEVLFYTWINGCPDTVSSSIFILDIDDSLLVYDINCLDPYKVKFYIDSSLAALSCGWTWDFGDGTVDSVNMNPIHTYAETGSYHVSIVYDCITEEECSGIGFNVLITDPVAAFEVDGGACDTPYTAIFTNTSTDGVDNNLTYYWNFDDGTFSTDTNTEHTYSDFGIYLVTLLITDVNGCTDYFVDTVSINQVNAFYTLDDDYGCTPFTMHLTDSSSSLVGDITSWEIYWADGTSDTYTTAEEMIDVTHTYTESGVYPITLIVYDANGCSDSYVDTIRSKLPFVDFIADDTIPCVGQLVTFTELATGTGISFLWDFGDGTTSTLANPAHAYSTLGSFTVSLTVTDYYGCVVVVEKPAFIIAETINADFDFDIVIANCNYSLVQFNSIIEDSICSFYWNFGDGGTSTDPNPLYPYLTAGSFDVSLTVIDCNDCETTIYKSGYIDVPGPFGYIVPSKDSVCVGEELILYVSIYSSDSLGLFFDNGDFYSQDIVFSNEVTTLEIPYTYNEAGYYGPTALVVDTSGCLNILYITDSILVSPMPQALYSVSDVGVCQGTEIIFSDSSYSDEPIISWLWNTGDSSFIENESIDFEYTYVDTGIYISSLEVQTAFGCTNTFDIPVTVIPYPIFNLSEDTIICPGMDVQLSATGGYTYFWSPPEGLSSSVVPDPIAHPLVSTLYTVIVTNGDCSLIDSVQVNVVEELILDAGPDTILCKPGEINLYALLTNDIPQSEILFYWQPDSFLNDIFIPDPISNTTETIQYTAYASCGFLDDSAIVTVVVTGPPDIDIPVDTISTIAGQPVNVIAEVISGNDPLTHEWNPSQFVDCPTCLNVNITVDNSMVLGILTTDSLGCTDYDYIYLRVIPCDESVFKIPNIISPNSDGFNDEFYIDYTDVAGLKSITIFDRWGERMFHTTDVERRWDGTYRGKICNPGVYVYTIEFICADGVESVISGNITLVK